MLAYAANTPKAAGRAGSPQALALILLGHAAVISAVADGQARARRVAAVRTDGPDRYPGPAATAAIRDRGQTAAREPVTQQTFIDQERPIVDMGQTTSIALDTGPSLQDIETVIGSGPTTVIDPPEADPVRIGPRLATNENALKPPYPLDMRRAEQEATLRLKLTIDPRGRVIAVDPVGPANPTFLEAARRHILKAWRYKPATEDGVGGSLDDGDQPQLPAGGRVSIAIARDWQSACRGAYIRAMAILPPAVGPRAALRDLKAFLRQRSREQVIGAALAVLVTIIIVIIFFVNSKINTAPPPTDRLCRELRTRAGPTPTSSPTRRRRPRSGARPRKPAARNSRSSRRSSALSDAQVDGRGGAAGRSRARPHRPQSQCRLRHRQGRQDRRQGRDGARRPAACRSGCIGQSREKGAAAPRFTPRSNPAPMPASAGRPALRSSRRPGSRRVVIGIKDPDPRTAGEGVKLLRKAGIEVKTGVGKDAARDSMSGYLSRIERGRPRITLKLALSIDGKIALPSGESKWITGEDARAHVHLERAHSDMILVGRGTYLADQPKLDVRLPGLEEWSPRRALLTRGEDGRRLGNPFFSAGCLSTS